MFSLVRTGVFPSYAPFGERLVSNDQTAGTLHNSVLLMNADGSRRSMLFTDPERSALAPVWSPQGDRIAFGIGRFFQMVNGPSIADIAVMRADGSGVQLLTDGSANYGLPSWSPDGRRLVYRAAAGDAGGLRIVDIETHAVSVLTTGHENFPGWSPKGDRIGFTSDRDGDYDIYTIKPDGTDVRRLTRTPGNDAHSAWSPDGEWIAFTSARGGFKDESVLHPYNAQPYGDLYVMRADGTDIRQLTDDQFEDGTPAWLPAMRRP
jgi:Tol biopolymer transport system component